MSTVQGNQAVWTTIRNENIEKCRNITEEIYKRINITFEIKKLENCSQSGISDLSDQIDSNELSNETDLFACDKSSITSSEDASKPLTSNKYMYNNNNEEVKFKKEVPVYKRPRKRYRKRVKKHQVKPDPSDSDESSDEALPLSRIIEIDTKSVVSEEESAESGSPDNVMGVSKIIILTKDIKPKIKLPDTKIYKQTRRDAGLLPTRDKISTNKAEGKTESVMDGNESLESQEVVKKCGSVLKSCDHPSAAFYGDKRLSRHNTMSHLKTEDITRKSGTSK